MKRQHWGFSELSRQQEMQSAIWGTFGAIIGWLMVVVWYVLVGAAAVKVLWFWSVT